MLAHGNRCRSDRKNAQKGLTHGTLRNLPAPHVPGDRELLHGLEADHPQGEVGHKESGRVRSVLMQKVCGLGIEKR